MTQRLGHLDGRTHEALPGGRGPDRSHPRRPGRLDLRLPRPERRRQDDRHQDARRTRRGRPVAPRGRRHPGRGRSRLPPRGRVPRARAALLRLDDRSGDVALRRLALSGRRPRRRLADRRRSDPGRPGRCRRPSNRHVLGRDAPAPRHRPGAGRLAGRAAARRAGQRARSDRAARSPRPDARAAGRGHGLLLHPHPRRRRARERPRGDPRWRAAHPLGTDSRAARELQPGPAAGRPGRRGRHDRRRPRRRSQASPRSNRPSATPTAEPISSGSIRAPPPPSRRRSRGSPPITT